MEQQNKKKNVHEGHRERMRNKYVNKGIEVFEQHEILEMLLFYAIPRKNTNDIAHRLLEACGSLSAVFDAPIDILMQQGLSYNAAVLLHMIPDLSRAYQSDKFDNEEKIITDENIEAQEITPYLPESEIATICRNLPQGIQERGREIRTFMPKFGNINERRNQLHEVIRLSGMNLIIDDTDHPLIIKVASIQSARMQVYFIDNEDFFQRKSTVSDENGNEYEDNDDRSIFYVRGVLETVKKLRWIPDVIHCHGWMSALTALYIKRMYADDPCLRNAKIVYSIYNDDFKNPLNKDFATKLKADGAKEADLKLIKADTSFVGLTKLAIDFADGVIQGSETINQEVLDYISAKKDTPFLPYQSPETYMDEFNKFYDVVLDSNTK